MAKLFKYKHDQQKPYLNCSNILSQTMRCSNIRPTEPKKEYSISLLIWTFSCQKKFHYTSIDKFELLYTIKVDKYLVHLTIYSLFEWWYGHLCHSRQTITTGFITLSLSSHIQNNDNGMVIQGEGKQARFRNIYAEDIHMY